MQNELLAKYPKADVRVYAVWFTMFPGDGRDKWPAELLTDGRVMHRWDEPKAVGMFFGSNKAKLQPRLTADSNGTGGEVLWDSYLLYGPDARWDDFPTGLRHWGRTIVAARGTLAEEFERMFAASAAGSVSDEYSNRGAQRRRQLSFAEGRAQFGHMSPAMMGVHTHMRRKVLEEAAKASGWRRSPAPPLARAQSPTTPTLPPP